jgi:hypothetical protein
MTGAESAARAVPGRRLRAAELRWQEPTARLPLRWGTYRGRYLAGLLLIVGGLLHLQSSTTHLLWPLVVGTAAHTVGWWILPAAGWRRLVVPLACGVQVWLLLTGPQSMWTLVIPFSAWLLVRHRPGISYLTVLLVVGNGVLAAALFREYAQMPLALTMSAGALAGAAWFARYLASTRENQGLRR